MQDIIVAAVIACAVVAACVSMYNNRKNDRGCGGCPNREKCSAGRYSDCLRTDDKKK